MEQEMLRKLQLTELEILREIKRVCWENGIRFFLCSGTFLGAVRHQGFIPWDDDLDIGMLREDYERFCRIAPEKLHPDFCLQNWHTDSAYALPFGKVRKRNTLLVERKSIQLEENGIYVDVFPFDFAPTSSSEQRAMAGQLVSLFRRKMMKSGMRPWMENDQIVWKKRIGFLYYQFLAMFDSHEKLIHRYEALAASVPDSPILCRQRGWSKLDCYNREWCEELDDYPFEGELFPGPKQYDLFLSSLFGDYWKLPPEETRENRHQIVRLNFGDGSGEWVDL